MEPGPTQRYHPPAAELRSLCISPSVGVTLAKPSAGIILAIKSTAHSADKMGLIVLNAFNLITSFSNIKGFKIVFQSDFLLQKSIADVEIGNIKIGMQQIQHISRASAFEKEIIEYYCAIPARIKVNVDISRLILIVIAVLSGQ
jgi:hypothetical protein